MKVKNNFRFADKGKVLINLESLTSSTSTILPLGISYKEIDQEGELIKLKQKYKIEDDENG